VDIAYLLRRAAVNFRGETAVDDGRTRVSVGELVERGEHLANALDGLGIPVGASVGILSENRTEYIQTDVGLALGRRVRVALNSRLHLEDFRHVAADSSMRALFYSASHAESAQALQAEFGLTTIAFDDFGEDALWMEALIRKSSGATRVRESDVEKPAWITYTSGTTGRPKGIVLSHRAIREVAFNVRLELGPIKRGELLVLAQAVSHGAGYFVLPYLISGAGVYVMTRFDPEQVWALSDRKEIRTFKAVPAMFEPLLRADAGRWGFESIIYGASGISEPVLEQCLERFGPSLIQDYGQSEAPITITCLGKDDHLDKQARMSAGKPWLNVAVEVRDEDGQIAAPDELGEVYVRGTHMMTEYHRNPEATAAALTDGWLRTRDLARTDDRGFVYLRGRSDDMIISGGHNIAPREVEDVLVGHADVDEVVVFGTPDARWGSMVVAVVRVRDHAELSPETLIEFARPRLGMRTPKRVVLAGEIPRTPYGKVDRVALQAQFGGPET
jgi:fatty-acyl-CoA synthase